MELTIAGPARHAWRDGDVVTTGAFVQEFRYPTQPNRPSEDEDLDLRVPGVTRSRTFALMPPGAVDGVNHRWASTACLARRGRRDDRGLRSRISISNRPSEDQDVRAPAIVGPGSPLLSTGCHGRCETNAGTPLGMLGETGTIFRSGPSVKIFACQPCPPAGAGAGAPPPPETPTSPPDNSPPDDACERDMPWALFVMLSGVPTVSCHKRQ